MNTVEAEAFLNTWIGVSLNAQDLRPLIGNQATPYVRAIPGNGVFNAVNEWIAYGGCLGLNRDKCVAVRPDCVGARIAAASR